jgi:esterase
MNCWPNVAQCAANDSGVCRKGATQFCHFLDSPLQQSRLPNEAENGIVCRVELKFQAAGEGFPLVVLHGLFGSSDNWAGISRRLADTSRVFAVDLRNHGESPHSDDFNYELMAGDIAGFMDRQGLPQADVLGHSMGGKAAMRLALDHPDRVRRLIVADMAPRPYAPAHREILAAMRGLDLSSAKSRADLDAALAGAIPETTVRQFLLKSVARDERGFRWKLNLDAINRHYDELNAAIESDRPFPGPALFIRGGRSMHVLDADMEGIRRLFPAARLVTLPEAGHWVHADVPEEFARAVKEFLA